MSELSHEQLSADEPWPGLSWFEEVDQPYFRGRAVETDELIRLVRREPLTALFGRSGLGKTSLLKAGLFPALRKEDFLPVYIRLEHADEAPPLRDQVWKAVEAAVEQEGVQGSQPLPEEELWTFLHRRDAEFWSTLNRPVTPVIVLDQFEEIFTLGQEGNQRRWRSEQFLSELADLVENRPPAVVKQRLEQEPEAAACYEFRRATSKLVLSFREDFLAEIERLKTGMPSLMVNRLRLLPMNGSQAYAVVTEAGGHLADDEVARRLLQLTWRNTPDPPADFTEFAQMEIDPALLSVVCRELNNKRRESIPPLPRITAELMAGADREILKGFYERGMEGLNPGVRRFVEEELITQQGYRDSHDWEDALLLPGVTQLGLEQLITRRLLRGDERQGRRRLELTHDVLAKVVKDSRDNRRDREAEAAKAQERLAAAERERAAETAKGLRTTQRLLALSGMLGVCLVLIGGFAIRQSKQAQAVEKKARQVAEQNTQEAKKLADRLAATNKDLAKQKQAADQLANKLKQALELAAQREQLAIAASKRAEAEKVQADAQRKIAEQQQMKAEVAKLRVEKALKYADQQRRRANEEAQKAEDARLKLEAFKFLQTWEGMLLKPARLPTNEILIGVGHVIDEKECPSGQVKIDGACLSYANGINEQQAFRLLSADLEKTIRHLAQTFKANLNSNQRLALLSFVFNMGTYSENYPTLIKAVNEGRLDEVPKALMIYVEKGSPFEAGLRRRRQAEADLWNTPPNQSN